MLKTCIEMTSSNVATVSSMEGVFYELMCTFQNMGTTLDQMELVERQEFVLKTNQLPNASCTWLFGLEKNATRGDLFDLYCVLSEIKGKVEKHIEVTFEFEMKRAPGRQRYRHGMTRGVFAVNTQILAACVYKFDKASILHADGSVDISVKLFFPLRVVALHSAEEVGLKRFALQSVSTLHENLDKLFFEMEYSDIKIVTSDNMELSAHRLILQMQNPVFKSMLRSDLSESKTGVIKVTDLCGKTMKIILRYLYTSELSSNWKDPDIIVEFVYAAGKYQLTEVLEMIDDTLGYNMSNEYSSCIISLLSIVSKLSLKNSEARLLNQFLVYAGKVTTADELFAITGHQVQMTAPAQTTTISTRKSNRILKKDK